jgi:hypothetical protein
MRCCAEPTKERFMRTATLSNALADPLIRGLMAADNVDPVKLESRLRRIAEEITPSLSPTAKS